MLAKRPNTLKTPIFKESILATSIRMNPEVEERLDALVAHTGRTKSGRFNSPARPGSSFPSSIPSPPAV